MGVREICSGWANAGWHGLPFPGQEHRKAAAQAQGVCSDRLLGRPFLPVRAILPFLMDWMVHARLACRALAPLSGLVRNAVSSINVDSPRRGCVYRLGSKCSSVGRVCKKKSGAAHFGVRRTQDECQESSGARLGKPMRRRGRYLTQLEESSGNTCWRRSRKPRNQVEKRFER